MLRTNGDASRTNPSDLKQLVTQLRGRGISDRAIREILKWYRIDIAVVLDMEGGKVLRRRK